MGNSCVGPTIGGNGFLQALSAGFLSRAANSPGDAAISDSSPAPQLPARGEAPEPVTIPDTELHKTPSPSHPAEASSSPSTAPRPSSEAAAVPGAKKPQHVKRLSSAGLMVDSVLGRKTDKLKDVYSLGRKLGQGQFGTTYLCIEKATRKEFACKSIAKRKLATEEDVRREIQIMHHLARSRRRKEQATSALKKIKPAEPSITVDDIGKTRTEKFKKMIKLKDHP